MITCNQEFGEDDFEVNVNDDNQQLLKSFDSIFTNQIADFKQKMLKELSNDEDFKIIIDKKFTFMAGF